MEQIIKNHQEEIKLLTTDINKIDKTFNDITQNWSEDPVCPPFLWVFFTHTHTHTHTKFVLTIAKTLIIQNKC